MRRSTAVLWLACVALVVAGCRTPTRLGPERLPMLDGFRAGDEITVPAADGGTATFTEDTVVQITLRGAPTIRESFVAIDLVGEHLVADTGYTRYRIALEDIDDVLLDPERAPTWLRVLGWIGLGTVVALSAFVIWVAYMIANSGGGGGAKKHSGSS